MNGLLLIAAAAAFAAPPKPKAADEISSDITVRSKASGPELSVPQPSAAKPIIDEVLRSLSLGRDRNSNSPSSTVRVTPNSTRLESPFPQPPFLSLSPENIQALYDSWTFEVREVDGDVVQRSEGVGTLRENLDWNGDGGDGRLALKPGRRYRYRFVGRRGSGEFVVESDPVLVNSFTRRQYVGETRLEATIDELFVDGKAAFSTGSERYLDAVVAALRAGDPRPDGGYHLELYSRQPRAALAVTRAKALRERLASALNVEAAKIHLLVLPVERSEALAAFVPPAAGPRLQAE